MLNSHAAPQTLFNFLYNQDDATRLFMGERANTLRIMFIIEDNQVVFRASALLNSVVFIGTTVEENTHRTAHERLTFSSVWPDWITDLTSLLQNLLPAGSNMSGLSFKLEAQKTDANAFEWSASVRNIYPDVSLQTFSHRPLHSANDLMSCIQDIKDYIEKHPAREQVSYL